MVCAVKRRQLYATSSSGSSVEGKIIHPLKPPKGSGRTGCSRLSRKRDREIQNLHLGVGRSVVAEAKTPLRSLERTPFAVRPSCHNSRRNSLLKNFFPCDRHCKVSPWSHPKFRLMLLLAHARASRDIAKRRREAKLYTVHWEELQQKSKYTRMRNVTTRNDTSMSTYANF